MKNLIANATYKHNYALVLDNDSIVELTIKTQDNYLKLPYEEGMPKYISLKHCKEIEEGKLTFAQWLENRLNRHTSSNSSSGPKSSKATTIHLYKYLTEEEKAIWDDLIQKATKRYEEEKAKSPEQLKVERLQRLLEEAMADLAKVQK